MDYEQQQELLTLLGKTRKYVQAMHDEAESKHDSYGEYYMDDGMYEIMQETEEILNQIDAAIKESK